MPALIALLVLSSGAPESLVVVRDCDDHAATSSAMTRTLTELDGSGVTVIAANPTTPGSLYCWLDELEHARAALKRGIVAFDNVDLNGARTAFREAQDVFMNAKALLDGREVLAEVLTYRAWLAVLGKNSSEARDLLIAADDVDPNAAVDARRFPPALVTLRDDVRATRAQRMPRQVNVNTDPPGAIVFVNELETCFTPCTVSAPSRLAFIRAVLPKYAPSTALADNDNVALTLQPDIRRELIARDPAAIASLPVPALLTLQPVSRGQTLHAAVTMEEGTRELDLPLADPELVAARVTLLVANATGAITAGAYKPVYKRWWFWTAVGVVAAGTVTGIILATHDSSNGRVTFETP